MTPALPVERLERLIPRLASDHDGEVVATARVIGRTLYAAGKDWHDLAAALAVPETCPRWRDMTLGTRRLWLVTLLDWTSLTRCEANFCATIAAHWLPRRLTDKQVQTLDRLIERAWAEGVRL